MSDSNLCFLDRRDYEKLKYVTYHNHPYENKPYGFMYPKQMIWDGFDIGAATVNDDTTLKYGSPNNEKLTNPRLRQTLPTLPIQFPLIRGCFYPDVSSDLRFQHTENWKGCTNVTEKSFIPNRFQHFRHLCYDPQQTQYIIPEDTFRKGYMDREYHYAGKETRHDRVQPYRTGCETYADRVFQHNKMNQRYAY